MWTLQDEFISVLKPFDIENKGFVQKPIVIFKTDSVDTCTFSIPKFLYIDGIRTLNPIWGNVEKGNFTKNLHKIKVIFNKDTNEAEVAEFIILEVKEQHENDQIITDISCESLAFHELGKRGYKIALSSEDLYNEYNDWFEGKIEGDEPRGTLQYWTQKFMQPAPVDDAILNSHVWYYEIQMDWSSYAATRDSDKVYEEEYTASWEASNSGLTPTRIEEAREKERLVDIEASNIYNITQKLAETFGVFCKYKYLYDANYRIIGRRVIYYNNYVREQEGYLDLTYPYTTSSVSREYDGNDVTTKMFVTTVQSESGDTISIMDNEANKTLEDYLLNFDYLKQIGELTAEQITGIATYEKEMHQLNVQISNLQNTLQNLNMVQNDIASQIPMLKSSIILSQERIEESDDLLNNLIKQNGTEDYFLQKTENAPDYGILLEDTTIGGYYINISQVGIQIDTIHIYQTINYSSEGNRLINEITSWKPELDEYGNLYKIINVTKVVESDRNTVFLIYKYSPKLYYEAVKQTWEVRLAQDNEKLVEVEAKLEAVETKIATITEELTIALQEKAEKISDFEVLMGAALRESYWQPDNYNDYGNKYLDTLNPNNPTIIGQSGYSSFLWDTRLFDNEQKDYYTIGINEDKKYYPCINLAPHFEEIKDHLDELCFLFYDYDKTSLEEEPSRLRALGINSLAQYGFAVYNNQVVPVLLLTGVESMTQDSLNRLMSEKGQPRLGKLNTEVEGSNIITTIDEWVSLSDSDFINWTKENDDYIFTAVTSWCYPRIKIDSFKLKDTDQEGVGIKFDAQVLNNYEDFYILTRDEDLESATEVEEYNVSPFYCITIRPSSFFKYGIAIDNSSIQYQELTFNFVLSNASTIIYLDALQVLKENAFPRISYTITPSVFDDTFMYTAYNKLNRIVNINDVDLHLRNIQGYISQLELSLDSPWEDKYEIKNYRNKFEDLFTSIVAQTEAMQKNEFTMTLAANALTPEGLIREDVLQNTFRRVDFNYAFNNGALTIDEANGIWGTSDNGVVAFRGGGIFTATEQNENGDWQWNTGITPEGINADLITTGQLDTNRINIYAGDKLRFQMNGDGLYAYKSILEDEKLLEIAQDNATAANLLQNNANLDLDMKQYVVHNENGLFLVAEPGAYITGTEVNAQTGEEEKVIKVLDGENPVTRVEVSWDGFKLRDWKNHEVFYADPDTGNLTLHGRVEATSFVLIDENDNEETLDDYIADNSELGVFITNGLSSNDTYGVILGNNNDSKPMLIGSNSGITIAADINSSTQGPAVEMNKDGIALHGASINLTSGTDTATNNVILNQEGITIGTNGKLVINSGNFQIDEDGNVSFIGHVSATSLSLGGTAKEDFEQILTDSDTYKTISESLVTEDQKNVLQRMSFNEDEGLIIKGWDKTTQDDSPYSTATKNDGFYVRYNDTDVAKFTGLTTEATNLALGDLVVKKTSRGGWIWTDYTRS